MYFLNDLFAPYTTGTNLERWGAMLVLVATGGVVYALGVLATGAIRLRDIRQLIRSK
jgi:putative peptidoglycan lipid II flippase